MAVGGQPTMNSPKVEDPHTSEKARAKDKLFLLFGLRDQSCIEDYSCAIKDKILLHGRLYVTSSLVAFYSSIFGHETRKVLPFTRVVSISKVRVGLIPMLQFTLRLANGDHKRVMFTSFFGHYMEDCTSLCVALHRQHRPDRYKLHPDGKREGESGSSERGRAGTLEGGAEGGGGPAGVPVVDLACNTVQASAASIRRAAKLQAVSALPISPASVAGGFTTHKHIYKQDGFVSTADGSLYRQASDTDVESDDHEYSGSGTAHVSADGRQGAKQTGGRHPNASPFSDETPGAAATGPFGNRDRAHTTAGLSEAEKRAFASSTASAHKQRPVSRHRPSMSSPDASSASQGQGGGGGKHAAQKSTMVYLHTSSSPSGTGGRDRSASAVLDVHTGLDHTTVPPFELSALARQVPGGDGRERVGTDGTVGDASIPASDAGHDELASLPASRAGSVASAAGATKGADGYRPSGGLHADTSPSRGSNMHRVHSDTDLDRVHHAQHMSQSGASNVRPSHAGGDTSDDIRHSHSSASLKGHVQWERSEYAAPSGDALDIDNDSGSSNAGITPRPIEPDVTDDSITADASPLPDSFQPVPSDVWPRLGRMKLLTDIVLPMTVSACERSFLLDSAIFSVGDAHKAWGDRDIQQGKWTDAEHHASDSPDKIAAGGGSAFAAGPAHHARILTRALRLVMPLQGMGPLMAAQTDVEKVQRLSRYSMEVTPQAKGRFLLMESSARSFQVPYGDYFLTEEAIVLAPAPASLPVPGLPVLQQEKVQQGRGLLPAVQQQAAGSSTSESSAVSSWTRVLIFVRVNFQKSTLFKSKIVSETEKRTLAFAEAYCQRMQEQTKSILVKQVEDRVETSLARAPTSAVSSSRRTAPPGSASSQAPSTPRVRSRRRAVADQAAHRKASPTASGGSSPSSGPAEFISPTAAAAMANPALAIPKDELLASLASPTDAAEMNQQRLTVAYTQLYAAHAATVSQVRHLREQVATLSARRGSGSGADRDDRAGIDRSWGRGEGTPSRQGLFAWDRSPHPTSERGMGSSGYTGDGGVGGGAGMLLAAHAGVTPVRRQLSQDLGEDVSAKPWQVRYMLELLVLGLIAVAISLGILVLWRGLSDTGDDTGITTASSGPATNVPQDVREEIIRELLQRLKE